MYVCMYVCMYIYIYIYIYIAESRKSIIITFSVQMFLNTNICLKKVFYCQIIFGKKYHLWKIRHSICHFMYMFQ